MSLLVRQGEMAEALGKLIQFACERNYTFTLGDAYRDPRAHFPYSSLKSKHTKRLAIDLNLFIDGAYIRDSDHPVYHELGAYWESLGGIWGGRFNDSNHYEWPEE